MNVAQVTHVPGLGAGGASTAARTGDKLANLHKLSGEPLPRLRQTARCMQFFYRIIPIFSISTS